MKFLYFVFMKLFALKVNFLPVIEFDTRTYSVQTRQSHLLARSPFPNDLSVLLPMSYRCVFAVHRGNDVHVHSKSHPPA